MALRELGWGGLELPVHLLARPTMTHLHAGEAMATVAVQGGSAGAISAVSTHAVAGPSLGAYLVHHHLLKPGERLLVNQGVEMRRPSEIHVEVAADKDKLTPKVSGSAVRIFEGEIDA